MSTSLQRNIPTEYSLVWPIWGRASGQSICFFSLSLLNRVHNFICICPKQGMVSMIVAIKYGLKIQYRYLAILDRKRLLDFDTL